MNNIEDQIEWRNLSDNEKLSFKKQFEVQKSLYNKHVGRNTYRLSMSSDNNSEKFLNSSFDYRAESEKFKIIHRNTTQSSNS